MSRNVINLEFSPLNHDHNSEFPVGRLGIIFCVQLPRALAEKLNVDGRPGLDRILNQLFGLFMAL